jgi:enhancing lycopene biosynthesis protein 2
MVGPGTREEKPMPKVGVVLSGCGVFDGAEIHESVITLLALDRAGAEVVCCAPDVPQMHVVDHRTGDVVAGETRNVLTESARIARGEIVDVKDVSADDIDALIVPGGFGAAKNLCSFAVDGENCAVQEDVARLVRDVVAKRKPLGAICIAPVLVAKAFEAESWKPRVTIGTDEGTAGKIEAMDATHVSCPTEQFVVDEERKIVTTPAYMLAGSIREAAEGIEKTVRAVLDLI